MDTKRLITDAAAIWDAEVLPTLRRYIEIPAQSRDFDPDWKANGHIDAVLALARDWVMEHAPPATIVEIVERDGRTPVLLIEIPATDDSGETAFLYAHLDKQPPFEGWDATRGLEPWKAVDIHDERGHLLFGRGGADDGYGVFAAITAIGCLEIQDIPHPRCV
ncbi:MAG: peptidase M20, partial [Bacteroidota bacterium]